MNIHPSDHRPSSSYTHNNTHYRLLLPGSWPLAMALLLPPSASNTTSLNPTTNPLADLLRSPDDLTKLSTHRKRLIKEKTQIDARLNECVKLQLEETKEGLRRLVDARQGVGRLREELIALEQVREEVEGAGAGTGGKVEGYEVYAKISKVSRVWRDLELSEGERGGTRTRGVLPALIRSLSSEYPRGKAKTKPSFSLTATTLR